MTEQKAGYSSTQLEQKRIGLIACEPIENALGIALQQVKASYAHFDPNEISPTAMEPGLFQAVVLGVDGRITESDWFRPEKLRACPVPVLLAGQWDAMNRRGSLVEHSDDVIFTPFSSRELIFRLCRLMSVQVQNRRTLVRPRKPCVVVADDDRDIIIYLKTVLANMDVDAHFVSDGKAALAAARRLLPNLLMLDVSMPIMNGIEVLRCLRNDPGTSSLRAVLLTASTDPDHVESSIKLGASEYILKPFGHVELTRKLKNMLRNSVVQ